MKGMGNIFRWLRKPYNIDIKCDTTKWCEFHCNHGHNTPNCIILQIEVAELLKKATFKIYCLTRGRTPSLYQKINKLNNL